MNFKNRGIILYFLGNINNEGERKMKKKQSIKCDVDSCKYNSNNQECNLDEIKVSSNCDCPKTKFVTKNKLYVQVLKKMKKRTSRINLLVFLYPKLLFFPTLVRSNILVPISGGVISKLSAIVAPITAIVSCISNLLGF